MSGRRRVTVCAEPGCPELAPDGPRCPAHAGRGQRVDADRPNAATRGYDAKWQATRKRYLLAHPWCQWPGCASPATDVDHIDGLGPHGPQGYDWDNLQSLCVPHHRHKTNKYDGGFGNPRKPYDRNTPGAPGSRG